MKKKILFFINTLRAGGAERVLVDMVNNIDKTKYQITVQTLLDGGEFCNSLSPDVKYKSIIRTNNAFLRKVFVYAFSFLISPGIVHKLFVGKEYDVECAFLEGVPTKLISASGNKRSQKYAWIHTDICNNLEVDKVFGSLDGQIECYRKFDKIICVSEGVKNGFIKLCGNFENVSVLYNVINDKKIREQAIKGAPNKEFTVLTVGRLEAAKGYDRLLRVHKRLIDEGYKYKLILAGDGSMREELSDFVRDNSLLDVTEFLGFCDNPYQHIINADLLVFPSRIEGFCTAVCESIILGKPVVATDCFGVGEILGDSEFGLVTANSEEGIYDGIKKMLSDEALRLEYANKALCRAKSFSLKKGIQDIEKIFG